MPARLKCSRTYIQERTQIKESLVRHARMNSEDPKKALSYFNTLEKELKDKIKEGPLYAGELFSFPVRRAVSKDGNYAIFYTPIPADAETNALISMVNLASIVPTSSEDYSYLTTGFVSADLDNDE